MEFLNLSFLQFAGLLGAVGAFSVALYLLDRNRRNQVVATPSVLGGARRTRRSKRADAKFSSPCRCSCSCWEWLCFCLPSRQFQLGGHATVRHDHVLVLDTSAWMGAAVPDRSGATLMDMTKANALAWLRAVPRH